MICSKCGFECSDSKYCPKCGTKMVRECKKCGAVLTDGDFCPNCGKDNSKSTHEGGWETTSLVSFIATIVLAGLKIVDLFTMRISIHVMVNRYFFSMPYYAYIAIYATLAALVILFSCIYRKTQKKGFGIVAIVLASILKVLCSFSFAFVLVLAGTIVHYIAVKKTKVSLS